MDTPLTRSHLAELNKGQAALAEAVKLADLAESIGADVREAREQIDYWRQRTLELKNKVFPGAK